MGCRMERGEELDGEEAQLTQFSFASSGREERGGMKKSQNLFCWNSGTLEIIPFEHSV